MESLEAADATIIELRTKHRVEKRRADEAESKLERSIGDHRVTTVQYQAATEALQNARTDNEKFERLHDAIRNERATAAATAVEERQERQAVEKKLEDMRERRDDCERQYLAANSRETNLKIELKHANDKIEHQCEEIKRLQHAIVEKNDRISELEGQIAGFRQQVEGTNTEGRVTNAELTAVRKQLKDTQNDRNDLRITLAERDRTLQSWREFVFN